MTLNGVLLDQDVLSDFCVRNSISRLSLFGSILGDRFGPESDVDFLVDFEPGALVSLFDIARMELELSDIVGRKVDLRSAGDLSIYFRDEVVQEARPLYAS